MVLIAYQLLLRLRWSEMLCGVALWVENGGSQMLQNHCAHFPAGAAGTPSLEIENVANCQNYFTPSCAGLMALCIFLAE
jgi:hypothetical protein